MCAKWCSSAVILYNYIIWLSEAFKKIDITGLSNCTTGGGRKRSAHTAEGSKKYTFVRQLIVALSEIIEQQ